MAAEPGHHFESEHGANPHCYACRKAIEINDLIVIYRLQDTCIWWHYECAPPERKEAIHGHPGSQP